MSSDSIFAAPLEHDEAARYASYGAILGESPDPKTVLELCRALNVRFMRLTFTDIAGHIKNVEVPASQFPKALDGEIMFDGSSIEGFTRIEESDMLLVPDLDTFQVFPWQTDHGRVGRQGKPFGFGEGQLRPGPRGNSQQRPAQQPP